MIKYVKVSEWSDRKEEKRSSEEEKQNEKRNSDERMVIPCLLIFFRQVSQQFFAWEVKLHLYLVVTGKILNTAE